MKRVRVVIFLKPGVLDAQGQAVAEGLRALGFEVDGVRVGKAIELVVPHDARVPEMCSRFLANPLIEEWEVFDA